MPWADWRFAPLLAIDAGQIIGLLVLLFTVLSWVVSAIQGAQKNFAEKNAKGNRNPGPQASTATKIEDFLREAGMKLPSDSQKQMAQNEQARQRQVALERRRAKEQRKKEKAAASTPATPVNRTLRQEMASRDAQRSSWGETSQTQNADHPSLRTSKLATTGAGSQTNGSGQGNLAGQQTSQLSDTSRANVSQFGSLGYSVGNQAGAQTENLSDDTSGGAVTESVHPLVAMLRKPGGMATAVLLNEILSKPRALQRDNQSS